MSRKPGDFRYGLNIAESRGDYKRSYRIMLGRTSLLALAAAALLSVGSLPAKAGVIDWTLQNVVFDDGGTLTGTFTTDSTTGDVLDFAMVSSYGRTLSGTTYDTYNYAAQNNFWGADSFELTRQTAGGDISLELGFANPLTIPGTDVLLTGNGSYECANCYPARRIISGDAVSATVPEPASVAIFAMGLIGLGAARRRWVF